MKVRMILLTTESNSMVHTHQYLVLETHNIWSWSYINLRSEVVSQGVRWSPREKQDDVELASWIERQMDADNPSTDGGAKVSITPGGESN